MASRDSGPISVAEVLARDNVPATSAQPADVAEQLTTHKLHLTGDGAALTETSQRIAEGLGGGTVLTLPASVSVGLPGDSFELVEPDHSPGNEEGAGMKPDWADLVYHPKTAPRSTAARMLTSAEGHPVIPVNQSFVYPPEQRQVFYPKGYPWHAIGKVEVFQDANSSAIPSWGSGVLIGDRVVLTAGHVPSGSPNPNSWKIRFTAGDYDGASTEGAGAASYVSDWRGWRGDSVTPTDYAILRLYEPLGKSLGYFGWKTYADSWNGAATWWLAGYPFDIASGGRPSYQNGIAVLADPSGNGGLELQHHGDIASGDSGGPFWGYWPQDSTPYVVGTVSGHIGSVDENVCAGGAALSNLLQWGRTNWPA